MKIVPLSEAKAKLSAYVDEAAAEGPVVITKNGRPVAKIRPQPADIRDDPEWRAAYEQMMAEMRSWRGDGYRVGKITEEDKYGPLPG